MRLQRLRLKEAVLLGVRKNGFDEWKPTCLNDQLSVIE